MHVLIFPPSSHTRTHIFACLQLPNIFLFLNNKGRKTSFTSDISLRLWQRWKSNLHLFSGPSECKTPQNRPKRLETRFMKPSSWERQPTSKNTILVSPRETDENKNDIKGSSQFLAQIKGDEFLAALNARLSPGIEIDIN